MGAAALPGIDGLIPLLVLELLLDVGGQGHFPKALQHLQENPLVLEADQTVSVRLLPDHLGGQGPVAKVHPGPGPQLPPRADQALPDMFALVSQQQHWAMSSCGRS